MLSKKSTLIVYIQICLADKGMNSPLNLFLDLIELETVMAKGIFDSLLECLQSIGMTESYLKSYLISVACDGAAVMFGCHNGVKKLFTERFPSLIVWHYANHRLELSVGEKVKTVSGINRFKSFIDMSYIMRTSKTAENCTSAQSY
jgi:hypothetical protein